MLARPAGPQGGCKGTDPRPRVSTIQRHRMSANPTISSPLLARLSTRVSAPLPPQPPPLAAQSHRVSARSHNAHVRSVSTFAGLADARNARVARLDILRAQIAASERRSAALEKRGARLRRSSRRGVSPLRSPPAAAGADGGDAASAPTIVSRAAAARDAVATLSVIVSRALSAVSALAHARPATITSWGGFQSSIESQQSLAAARLVAVAAATARKFLAAGGILPSGPLLPGRALLAALAVARFPQEALEAAPVDAEDPPLLWPPPRPVLGAAALRRRNGP